MAGKSPFEAYRNFQDSLNETLSCVTAGRLSVPSVSDFETDFEYSIVLNYGRPVTDLRGYHQLTLSVLQRFVIQMTDDEERGPYKVRTNMYVYQVATRAEEELFAYHWTPEEDEYLYRVHPHLHIGAVSITGDAPIPNFPKLHLPTARVSLESIIRLLIEDLGVRPRRDAWREILTTSEEAFIRYRTR